MPKVAWHRNEKITNWLKEAIDIDVKYTRRVIIDFSLDSAIVIYIEKFADDKMFEIKVPKEVKENLKIVTLDKA